MVQQQRQVEMKARKKHRAPVIISFCVLHLLVAAKVCACEWAWIVCVCVCELVMFVICLQRFVCPLFEYIK